MVTTKEWLMNSLILSNNDYMIIRNGRVWSSFAGYSSCGCVFAIYQDDNNYCVHSADEWKENEEPNLGYYDKSLSYDKLIGEIANNYDNIRNKIKNKYL